MHFSDSVLAVDRDRALQRIAARALPLRQIVQAARQLLAQFQGGLFTLQGRIEWRHAVRRRAAPSAAPQRPHDDGREQVGKRRAGCGIWWCGRWCGCGCRCGCGCGFRRGHLLLLSWLDCSFRTRRKLRCRFRSTPDGRRGPRGSGGSDHCSSCRLRPCSRGVQLDRDRAAKAADVRGGQRLVRGRVPPIQQQQRMQRNRRRKCAAQRQARRLARRDAACSAGVLVHHV